MQDAVSFISDKEAQHGGWPAVCPLLRHFTFCAAVKRDNSTSLSRNVLRSVG